MTDPRRKVSELLCTYDMHPELSDVICEGALDKLALIQFFGDRMSSTSQIYSVDEFDFELTMSLPGGNRSQLERLSQNLLSLTSRTSVLIDRDLYPHCGLTLNDRIIMTSPGAFELYGFEKDDLVWLLRVKGARKIQPQHVDTAIAAAALVREVRIFRLLNCEGHRIADAGEIIKQKGKNITIDLDGYINRCAQLNGYNEIWNNIAVNIPAGSSISFGTHDFSAIVSKIVRYVAGVKILEEEIEQHFRYRIGQRLVGEMDIFERIEQVVGL